jgi:hypothetical protein
MAKLRTNTKDVQKKMSKLLKKGIRVFPQAVTVGASYVVTGYTICLERKTSSGKWGYKHDFKKKVAKKLVVDAYVKTIEYLYDLEILGNENNQELIPIKDKHL